MIREKFIITWIKFPETAVEAQNLPYTQKRLLAAFLGAFPSITYFDEGLYDRNLVILDELAYLVGLSDIITKTPKKNDESAFTYRFNKPEIMGKGGHNSIHKSSYKGILENGSISFFSSHRSKLNKHKFVDEEFNEFEYLVWEKLYGHCRLVDECNILVPELPGINLYERLLAPITVKDVTEMAIGVLSEVKRVFAAGFIHGDIKTSNFLCDDTNRISIIDFERCLPLEMAGIVKYAACSLDFAAPEIYTQIYKLYKGMKEEVEYDARQTDIYAVGVVLVSLFAEKSFWVYFAQRNHAFVLDIKNKTPLKMIYFDYQATIAKPL